MLTTQEEETLFGALRSMVDQGISVIFITHKLHEAIEVSDRITVLRNGRLVRSLRTAEAKESDLAGMMIGSTVSHSMGETVGEGGGVATTAVTRETILEIKNLWAQ